METNKIRKGIIKMLEMIVLGLTIVIAQIVAGVVMMKVFMSERFLKKYTKTIMNLSNEIVADLMEESEEEV